MKPISRSVVLLVGFFCALGHAFLPPVNEMLRGVTEGRKNVPVELVVKHRIAVRGSGTIELEERIFDENRKTLFIWSGGAFGTGVGGTLENTTYRTQGQEFPTKSVALIRYLTASGAEELRDGLIAERMIRRDQLAQFKPGFSPEGDPQTWNVKENYLIHPDIFLRRLENGIAIAVVGSEEGDERRTVLFDKGLKGIRKLEWKEAEGIQSWNCEGFTPFGAAGNYPRRLFFENNGSEVIQSDILAVRVLNAKSAGDFKNSYRQAEKASLSNNGEGILKLLLSYR